MKKITLAGMLLSSFFSFAQLPSNDECDAAIALTVNADQLCGTVLSGTTLGGTASPQPDDVSGTPSNDVWYVFEATSSQHRITISDVTALEGGTSTDMGMAVYSGDCAMLVFEDTSDPNVMNLTGLIEGNNYYVRVYGWSEVTNPMSFDICIGTPVISPPPVNDECDAAIALTVNADQLCGTVLSGTTLGGTASPQDDSDVSGTPGNDVWYVFEATSSQHRITISDVVALEGGDSTDMGMAVYSGDCAMLTFEDTSDPNVLNLTGLVAGTNYYVRVYGWYEGTNPMSFDICIGTPVISEPPVNDECEDAISLTVNDDQLCGVVTAGTTAGGTPSAQDDDVSGTPANDVWYTFEATATQHKISLLNIEDLNGDGETDMGIGVYSGDCAALDFEATSDPESFSVNNLVPGTTYYVRVYGWYEDSNPMSFDICIGTPVIANPPANDECSGAVLLVADSNSCSSPTAGTTAGATASPQDDDVSGTPNNDVWYTFVATGTEHRITVGNIVNLNENSGTDMGIGVYAGGAGGDCSDLTFVDTSDPESFTVTGLTEGDTYYIRVYGWNADSDPMSFDICVAGQVAVPDNDDCSGATTALIPSTVSQDASGATNGAGFAGCDGGDMNDGVWYTFTGTGETIDIMVNPFGWDPELGIYSGDCDNLECIASIDDGASGTRELYSLESQAGVVYYVNIGYYSSSTDEAEGPFTLSFTQPLSVPGFDASNFKAYPNPVKNVLNLDYIDDITSVTVFNLLGQQMLSREINASKGQLDMSGLTAGSYLVKVVAGSQMKTIKVIKQ